MPPRNGPKKRQANNDGVVILGPAKNYVVVKEGPYKGIYKGTIGDFRAHSLNSDVKILLANTPGKARKLLEEVVISNSLSTSNSSNPLSTSLSISDSSNSGSSSPISLSPRSMRFPKKIEKVEDTVYVAGVVDGNKIKYGIIITMNGTCYYGESSSVNEEPTQTLATLRALQVALNVLENETELKIVVNDLRAAELATIKKVHHFQEKKQVEYQEYVDDLQARRSHKKILIKHKDDEYIRVAETLALL